MHSVLYDYRSVTVDSVREATDAGIAAADALVAKALSAPPSFDGALVPLELAGAELGRAYGRGGFLGQVHTDAAVRDAGNEAEERINKWRVALVFRRDLYEAVRAFAATEEARALEGEHARLLAHWMRDFRRAGHELDDTQRTELEALRTRLVEIEVAFDRNISEYRDGLDLTRDQLDGLPDAYVERLRPGSQPGTYHVSLDYPEVNPFLDQARDRELRRIMFTKNWSRAVDANRPLLEEALRIRRRIAELLGLPTWAHYAMEVKMAREPDRVRRFYEELLPALGGTVAGEHEQMNRRLKADGHDSSIGPWDWRFYDNARRRDEFGVDQDAVSEYFPIGTVMDGMLAITAEVFGLEYRALDDARAWHDSVRAYEILDRASGDHLAVFYTDLFPRDGKFSHAAAFPLEIGHRAADGGYVAPVSAIVANFTPPSGDRPSLLKHAEVQTLFHEFGHILHMSLTHAEFARFSAAETEWDFVEAPSQIMEHWTWQPAVLERISRHYQTSEPMPPGLVEQLVRARYVDVGGFTALQTFYGKIDLALHAAANMPDLDEALRETYEVTGLPYPDGTFMLAGFGHLLGGYDAGYYGYLWAAVIGDDLFSRFSRDGVLSPTVGADYRRTILEPNGSRDADEMVRAFLGREPSNEEFLRLRGMA